MRITRQHRLARKTAPRMSVVHYGRSKVVGCPFCGSQAGAECKRSDGKPGRPHRERVLAFEQEQAENEQVG